MSDHRATIVWDRAGAAFVDRGYSRAHVWRFDGGAEIPASPSPHVVPAPMSVAANVDPEEAFVAALASCHMLFFLDLCARRKLLVDRYADDAVGVMGTNAAGKQAMTQVTLRPRVVFAGDPPTRGELAELHEQAHELCFIANSVTTRVTTDLE